MSTPSYARSLLPLLLALVPAAARAETPAEPAKAEPPKVEKWFEYVTFEGLADAYYGHTLQGAARGTTDVHIFDSQTGTFDLGYAELALTASRPGASLRLDFGFGRNADQGYYDGDGATGALIPTEIFKNVQQAYGSFELAGGTLDVGKFATSAGWELLEAKANWNYSRSMNFNFAGPFTHTGLRYTRPLNEEKTQTIQFSLVNGWEAVTDNNKFKTLGFQYLYNTTLTDADNGTVFAFNLYTGPEGGNAAETSPFPWRLFANLVFVKNVDGKMAFGVDATYARELGVTTPNAWAAGAGYATYVLANARLTLRLEGFMDNTGSRLLLTDKDGKPFDGLVVAPTFTVGVPFQKNGELRCEVRNDMALGGSVGQDVFGGHTSTMQTQFLASGLVWF